MMREQVTKHSAASMNEHYRKILNKWTPKERRNAIENAQVKTYAKQL